MAGAFSTEHRPYIQWDGPKPTRDQFQDYTFIVASISVANIGQMTVDLIMENLQPNSKPVRVGYFVCPKTLVAVAGEFDEEKDEGNNLVSSCEIYLSEVQKLIILQHHGVIAQGQTPKFAKYIVNFIRYLKIRKVLVLSSSFASQRTDSDLDLGPNCIHYAKSSGINPSYNWDVSGYGWKNEFDESSLTDNKNNEQLFPILRKFKGTGITPLLFEGCIQNQVENLTLFLYTSDGDNRQDAVCLFIEANRVLNLIPKNDLSYSTIKIPNIWNLKSDPPPGIY